jgi:hypothetical protein
MADAADSKSATRKGVKVRLLSPALYLSVLVAFLAKSAFYKAFRRFRSAKLCNEMKQKPRLKSLIGYNGRVSRCASPWWPFDAFATILHSQILNAGRS